MNDFAWFCLTVISIVVIVGAVKIVEIIYDHKDKDLKGEED